MGTESREPRRWRPSKSNKGGRLIRVCVGEPRCAWETIIEWVADHYIATVVTLTLVVQFVQFVVSR